MTYLILSVLLWLWDNRSFDTISQNNVARTEAMQAYEAGQYDRATEQYKRLVESSLFVEPSARLNLAHSLFHLHRYREATTYYRQVAQVTNSALSATAQVQLGVIACQQGDSATALTYFRKALNTEPTNESAQFNYELIKKTYSGKPNPLGSHRPKPRPKPTQTEITPQQGQQGGNEVEKSDQKTELLRRLQSMNLSEEQALTILNAMQANEVQYIQQRKQSSASASKPDYKNW